MRSRADGLLNYNKALLGPSGLRLFIGILLDFLFSISNAERFSVMLLQKLEASFTRRGRVQGNLQ